jgi:enoyl-[acyl-carrier protein] reductase II
MEDMTMNKQAVQSTETMNKLWNKGQQFLGVDLPIICGAMTWISNPELVATVCNYGGFASLAAGNMPPELLAESIDETRTLTDKPFAANIIVIAPNYHDHLEICCQKKMSHIVFAGSMPRKEDVEKAKASGAKVICFASTSSMADRMINYGADALVLEGSEAGGHIGHVSTIVLLQEILFKYSEKLPIFVAGGIADGSMVGHLCLMGAAGVQLGTQFVLAEECVAHDNFKNAFIKARSRQAISTPQYSSKLPVVAVRALNNKAMDNFGELQMDLLDKLRAGEITRQDAQFEVEKYWVGSLKTGAVDGDVKDGSLMAGQSVGLCTEVRPMREILQLLVDDADSAVQKVSLTLK